MIVMAKDLTLDQAKQIQEAFGPNSCLYETQTLEELYEEVQRATSTVVAYLRLLLTIEDVHWEQEGYIYYQEWKQVQPKIIERLRVLGWKV